METIFEKQPRNATLKVQLNESDYARLLIKDYARKAAIKDSALAPHTCKEAIRQEPVKRF
jgi:hypothetical protein